MQNVFFQFETIAWNTVIVRKYTYAFHIYCKLMPNYTYIANYSSHVTWIFIQLKVVFNKSTSSFEVVLRTD